MDLTTATPQEVDEVISDLEGKAWAAKAVIERAVEKAHYAAGDKQRNQRWQMTDSDALDRVRADLDDDSKQVQFLSVGGRDEIRKVLANMDAAVVERDRLAAEIDRHEDEYRRRGTWSRFFKLRSTKGSRIHDTRWCPGLHRSDLNDLGWRPDLSGKSEAEAVKALGPVMCSKCFRSAPVEWRRDPKDLRVDPNACPGGEEAPVEGTVKRFSNWQGVSYWGKCTGCGESRKLRQDSKVVKHVKPKGKGEEGKITAPDGTRLSGGGYSGDYLDTERAAMIRYVDVVSALEGVSPEAEATYDAGWRTREVAIAERLLAALAHKETTRRRAEDPDAEAETVEQARERMAPKVTARVKKNAREWAKHPLNPDRRPAK